MGKLDSDTEAAARRFLGRISGQYPVAGAIVYGSRARGTHQPESDADLAVLLDGPHLPLMRTALAMGGDRAIHVQTDDYLEPLAVAKLLRKIAEREQPQLILLGKQAIDDDANQTAQMLAALLNAPQGTFAGKIELSENEAIVTREIDGGSETLALKLPAVISTDLRLNEPRYVKLPQIMQAKKKPLEKLTPEALNVNTAARVQAVRYAEPQTRRAGVKAADAADLAAKLKAAKVI